MVFLILLKIFVNIFILNCNPSETLWTSKYLNFEVFPHGKTGPRVESTKKRDFNFKKLEIFIN